MSKLSFEDWTDIEIQASLQSDIDLLECRINEHQADEARDAMQKYIRFFKKDGPQRHNKCLVHFATREAKVQLNENVQHTSHRQEFPLNSSCDVVTKIRQLEAKSNDIDEALLKTYPTKYFIKKCQAFQQKVIPEELQKMSQMEVDAEGSQKVRFIDLIEQTDFDDNTGVAARVSIPLLSYEKDLEELEADIDQLKEIARFNGYFMSQCEKIAPREQKAISAGIAVVWMTFEARYSKMDFEMPEFLCHLTLPENLHSISEKGLQPKSCSDVFLYPERVYFFSWETNGYKAMYGAAELLKGRPGEIAVLKVKSKKLEDYGPYKNGKMKFYIDPKIANLDNEVRPRAIYTYEPVPTSLLENEVELLQLDGNGNVISMKKGNLRC